MFPDIFTEMAVLLLLAAGVGALGVRLRQPLIVAFIAVGILVGPSVLGWVSAVTGCFIQESRFLKDQFEEQWLGFSDKQRQLKKSTFSTQSGLEEWVPTESL